MSVDSVRLDVALADRGLARSRSEAASLVSEGQVLVNGRTARKAGLRVSPSDRVELTHQGPRFVSRAGHKLHGALAVFTDVTPSGRRCLDAGASTGGFTDVLLRAGADTVLAVDVGHGQLVEELREDPRVQVHEGLNIRDITPEDVGGPVELVVSDLSFISLRLVVEALAAMSVPGADLVLMVKPQFEVGRSALPKGGVVRDLGERRRAVCGVVESALHAGLEPRGLARSPLPGQDGNVEFFLWLRRTTDPSVPAPATDAGAMTQRAQEWVAGWSVDWS